MLKKNCAYLALFGPNIAFFVKIFTKYFIPTFYPPGKKPTGNRPGWFHVNHKSGVI